MLMGKGGVGKTTLAAAVAVELARRGLPVHLSTSDPAAHLADTLDGALEHLTVSRIDPHAEATAALPQHVLATKGAQLDAQGRALLEEDLRSPCTEEIAVFQAFSRIIREAGKKFVVMDTAPTGHTLLLLDATGAYHREIAVRWATRHALHHADDAAAGPEADQGAHRHAGRDHPGAGSRQPAGRPAPRRHRALGLDHQQQRGRRRPTSPLLRQRARNERSEIDAVATRHALRAPALCRSPLLAAEPQVGVTWTA
jgi:arsenite-transporting ATPase